MASSRTSSVATLRAENSNVPTVVTSSHKPHIGECYTELSFAVVNSLAFARNLTWEQTPWALRTSTSMQRAHFNNHECSVISEYLNTCGKNVSPNNIHNSLFFGLAYGCEEFRDHFNIYPQLYVVFPHTNWDVSTDPKFMKKWYDEMVKPAFDFAWEESGLVPVYGGYNTDLRVQPYGRSKPYTDKEARDSKGLMQKLTLKRKDFVRQFWPDYPEAQANKRAEVYDEAWQAIKGMMKDHPDMPDQQDMFLLAVYRQRFDLNEKVNIQTNTSIIGGKWDRYVDARWMDLDSFKVIFHSIVHLRNHISEELDAEEAAYYRDLMGRDTKRLHEDDGDDEEEEKLAKRPRTVFDR